MSELDQSTINLKFAQAQQRLIERINKENKQMKELLKSIGEKP